MSNGHYRFARIDTAEGAVMLDDGWGGMEGITVLVSKRDADASETLSIVLTHEQYAELLGQLNEYAQGETPS